MHDPYLKGYCHSAALATVAENALKFKDARHLNSCLSQQLRTDHQRQVARRPYKTIYGGLTRITKTHNQPTAQWYSPGKGGSKEERKKRQLIASIAVCKDTALFLHATTGP